MILPIYRSIQCSWELTEAVLTQFNTLLIVYLSVAAVKSFWSPFKMKVQNMYKMPWTPLRDWAPLVPYYKTTEDHLLLLVTQETRNQYGLVKNNGSVERDRVKSLCGSHSLQVRNIGFIASVYVCEKDKDKLSSRNLPSNVFNWQFVNVLIFRNLSLEISLPGIYHRFESFEICDCMDCVLGQD